MPAGSGGIAHALFVSKDRRIPKLRIQTRQLENLLDKRIIVAVDSWDRQSRYPSGHYVRTIGEIGDRDTESEVCTFCLIAIIFLMKLIHIKLSRKLCLFPSSYYLLMIII